MELFEAVVPSVPYVGAVLVVGAFLWRVFVRMIAGLETRIDHRFAQIDERFAQMEERFDNRFRSLEDRFASLDRKVDGLAADHHGLSRELSEFRGEMRGRLSMLVPQAAGEA